MSASRDGYSQDSQHLEVSEQQHLSGSDAGGQQYDADYVPEREFVLMPLFRRIGQLFGIGRNEESEYVYEPAPEPQAAIQSRVAEAEPEASVQDYGFDAHAISADAAPEAASEDLLGIESQEPVQPFAAERNAEPESLEVPYENADAPLSYIQEPVEQATVAPVTVEQVTAEQAFDKPVEETRPETVPYRERPQLELVHSQSTAEQSTDLTAPLREAAVKISAAISQAAEWLHRKEEEILRGAELPQSTAAPNSDARPLQAIDSQRGTEPIPDLPLEAHTLIASTPVVIPQVERKHFDVPTETDSPNVEPPALQREVVWQGRRPEGASPEAMQQHSVDIPAEVKVAERKPRLVPAPVRVPYWKRVDWAQEFTPKRVAVLGGLAMAVLMVLGVSLARRPASSMLPPQQQQARTHQPGGVTLTTHPVAAAKTSPQQMRRASASSNAAAAPVARHSNPEPEYNDGPDVVTHYYNGKPKPSPAKQSTVAGVRHYSDM
jgi:hypothetical protein